MAASVVVFPEVGVASAMAVAIVMFRGFAVETASSISEPRLAISVAFVEVVLIAVTAAVCDTDA